MAEFYKVKDVMKLVNKYREAQHMIDDLLLLTTYDDDGLPTRDQPQSITNINFICSKDRVENILEKIAKNNDGVLTIIKREDEKDDKN